MSLNTVGDESITTVMVSALEDQCPYCHNSTKVIGVMLEENLAPVYPSWILYSQVIQYPIDFPFCHFSTFCHQKCLLSYDPILLLGILCCFSIWYDSWPSICLISGTVPFSPLTKGNLGNHFVCVSVPVCFASFTVWTHWLISTRSVKIRWLKGFILCFMKITT